jgi:Putative metallopeptidase
MASRFPCICGLACILLSGAFGAVAEPEPTPTDRARSEQFQARVDEAARALENNPRLKSLTQQQRKDVVEFVVGNTLFALVHEMGHAAISEMGLPVLGREEDAADAYAVLAMLRTGTAVSHRVLVDAATGWFMSDKRSRQDGIKMAVYDEHGLDSQRAYQIVCLMVGSDPDKFAEAAEKAEMPEDRQASCQGDYSNASWSWNTVLKPHRRAADQPKQEFDTVYGPAAGRLEALAQTFRIVRLLETAATYEAELYVWRRPIILEMQACGTPAAHWDLSAHKITICYEMGLDFAMLYRDFGLTPVKDFKQNLK